MFRLRGLTATINGTSPESISVIGLSLPQTSAEAKKGDPVSDPVESATLPAPAPLKQVFVIVTDKETISGCVIPFLHPLIFCPRPESHLLPADSPPS